MRVRKSLTGYLHIFLHFLSKETPIQLNEILFLKVLIDKIKILAGLKHTK